MATIVEQIIRQYVTLPTKASAKGWLAVVCKCCNDYKLRGAFLFTSDAVTYKCFNCPNKGSYHTGGDLTEGMQKVLKDFGVPERDIGAIILDSMENKNTNKRKVIISTSIIKPIDIPKHFYKLTDDKSDIWSQVAIEYLKVNRGMNISDYQFYMSKDKAWVGRLIIPILFQGEWIFYQGRDLTEVKPNKYKNAAVKDSTLIIYGYDNISIQSDTPLFIVEGFFDAVQLEGVAILGNSLTTEKINYINRSPRQKIYIPDRYGDGKTAALNALQAGWSISIPETPNCKDMGEAIKKYGKMYVIKSILDNTTTGFEAITNINLYCK